MSSIYDWSLTPGDNATADSDINWAEGMFPSSVNNSAREMMTRLAQYVKDNGVLDALGTNTIAITSNSPITAVTTGMTLAFRAAATNTTAVTLNLNGLGGKDIRKVVAGGTDSVALSAGDINIKGIYLVVFDATTNAGAGGWILVNPLPQVIPSPLPVSAGGTGSTTAAGARTNLGLGTMATQNANAVAITGGTVAGSQATFTNVTVGNGSGDSGFLDASGAAVFATGAPAVAVFASRSANGQIRLRPNGGTDGTGVVGQASIDTSGNMVVAGSFTASGGNVSAGSSILQANTGVTFGSSLSGGNILTHVSAAQAAAQAGAIAQIMPTIAAQTALAVGVTIMARYTGAAGAGSYNAGTIVPGTDLGVCNAAGTTPFGPIGFGNWMAEGVFVVPSAGTAGVTNFRRVS